MIQAKNVPKIYILKTMKVNLVLYKNKLKKQNHHLTAQMLE